MLKAWLNPAKKGSINQYYQYLLNALFLGHFSKYSVCVVI